jgi:hypothetical protein
MWLARRRGGIDFDGLDLLRPLAKTTLLLHSATDRTVPVAPARKLADMAREHEWPLTYREVSGAEHVALWQFAPEWYYQQLERFFAGVGLLSGLDHHGEPLVHAHRLGDRAKRPGTARDIKQASFLADNELTGISFADPGAAARPLEEPVPARRPGGPPRWLILGGGSGGVLGFGAAALFGVDTSHAVIALAAGLVSWLLAIAPAALVSKAALGWSERGPPWRRVMVGWLRRVTAWAGASRVRRALGLAAGAAIGFAVGVELWLVVGPDTAVGASAVVGVFGGLFGRSGHHDEPR